MNLGQASPDRDSRTSAETGPVLLVVITEPDGTITSGSGRWPGEGAFPASTITDLVHARNHDLIERVTNWVGVSGQVDRGVGVQVRTIDGWDEAVLTAMTVPGGIQWCLVPVLPDPVRASVNAVSSGRQIGVPLDLALAAFDASGTNAWASVHFGPDSEGRYRAFGAVDEPDTFRRAVGAAVAGDQPCPWDRELNEDTIVGLEEFGDGIKLAGPRSGLTSCLLATIPAASSGDVACLAVWAENAEQLGAPDLHLLTRRTAAALTLAFQAEAGRDGLRTLATRDGLTGAWNRQAFFAQLKTSTSRRHCEVVCIDIDDFRAINDWHGYDVGDELIATVAERLRSAMRPDDVVGRVSGDEFAVLCFDVASDDAARVIAERVHQICDQPFQIAGESTEVSMTVGAALSAEDCGGVQLFDLAERMMLDLKSAARGTWRLA